MSMNRRICFTLFIICFGIGLSGCSKKEIATDFPVEISGQNVVISFSQDTWSEGKIIADSGVYIFVYSYDGTFTVIYPNGRTYHQSPSGSAMTSSWNHDKTPEELGYLSPIGISWAIEAISHTPESNGFHPLLSLALLALGIWGISAPKSIWWLNHGWRFKNAEPSELSLAVYRIIGGLEVLFAILTLLV